MVVYSHSEIKLCLLNEVTQRHDGCSFHNVKKNIYMSYVGAEYIYIYLQRYMCVCI